MCTFSQRTISTTIIIAWEGIYRLKEIAIYLWPQKFSQQQQKYGQIHWTYGNDLVGSQLNMSRYTCDIVYLTITDIFRDVIR